VYNRLNLRTVTTSRVSIGPLRIIGIATALVALAFAVMAYAVAIRMH